MAVQATGRRTPLGHAYGEASPPNPFEERDGGRIKHLIGQDAAGGEVALFDLTAYERFGIKGRGASAWLAASGLKLPERVNTMVGSARGFDIVRLGADDIVMLSRPGAPAGELAALKTAWQEDAHKPKGFDAWRDEVWAWFHICGEPVSRLMAMTCPVDLHPDRFALAAVAQTRVAQMDCIVVRSDRNHVHGFDLFFDIASSEFALRSLKELGVD